MREYADAVLFVYRALIISGIGIFLLGIIVGFFIGWWKYKESGINKEIIKRRKL